MKVRWHFESGLVGGDRTGEVEVDDDAAEEEINEIVLQDMWNFMGWSWVKLDENGKEIRDES